MWWAVGGLWGVGVGGGGDGGGVGVGAVTGAIKLSQGVPALRQIQKSLI